jgi:FdhD protein
MSDSSEMLRSVAVRRIRREGSDVDLAAVEEPLEVRLHGKPFAVIMRTPGQDRELAAGFLLSEGIISSPDDVGAIERCRHPHHPESQNVVDVYLMGAAAERLPAVLEERRNVATTSSCGLCGRVTIESLAVKADVLAREWTISPRTAALLQAELRSRQTIFTQTGGLHAAGLFNVAGECERTAEDVGRHNAVDKVVGAMVLDERLPLGTSALAVSGRVSFEIVQKAWIAGVPLVCAVSAPSTLAIDLAQAAGITLLGFTRGDGFNIYSHPERIGDD